ncbi:MAG: hypothetical protein ACHBN1_15835 [Heteroscytonema crispum UTEX LB 1556]
MLRKVLVKGIKLSFAILAIAIAEANTAYAQETPPPIFGDVTIGRKFSPDPWTVRGMSGGTIPASQVAGRGETATGPCMGFVDEKPDHTLVLTSKFDYLKLKVQSPEDTTLIVSGPGGSWCNDEFDGKNPGIIGEWLAGTYRIWIGSYNKENYLPYTLEITEAE